MPFITAKKIHDGRTWQPEGTVIEVDEAGRILSISTDPGKNAIHYDGVLVPGFVNAHCHLELSHMKGAVPEHTGLIPFLKSIPAQRNSYTEEQKKEARHEAYKELLRNGVVAVGDIANTTDALDLRAQDGLHWYTFVESIGFTDVNAARSFGFALQTYNAYAGQKPGKYHLKQNIVPHAPYSVSASLFRLIDEHVPDGIISIHNQESEEENKFFKTKEGGVRDLLSTLGIDDGPFVPTGRSSLCSYLNWLSAARTVILVHNTYTDPDDLKFALSHLRKAYWCLCPNANLYIENRLPDIDMFVREDVNICIGTDSLASNHQLSILAELHTIKKHYPHLTWELLIYWGTYKGALALRMEDRVGTIEVGKQPGILQLTDLDDHNATPSVNRVI